MLWPARQARAGTNARARARTPIPEHSSQSSSLSSKHRGQAAARTSSLPDPALRRRRCSAAAARARACSSTSFLAVCGCVNELRGSVCCAVAPPLREQKSQRLAGSWQMPISPNRDDLGPLRDRCGLSSGTPASWAGQRQRGMLLEAVRLLLLGPATHAAGSSRLCHGPAASPAPPSSPPQFLTTTSRQRWRNPRRPRRRRTSRCSC